MNNEILDLKQAAAFCGISPRQISDLLRQRLFPRPTVINSKPHFWLDECQEWRAENKAAKPAAPAQSLNVRTVRASEAA